MTVPYAAGEKPRAPGGTWRAARRKKSELFNILFAGDGGAG
jgi:hypothetical protein